MWKLLVVLFFAALKSTSAAASRELVPDFAYPCSTPNNNEGVCVELERCSVLMDALASGRINVAHDFIRKSWCSPPNEDLATSKICCGKYADYLNHVKPLVKHRRKSYKNPFPKVCGNQTHQLPSRIFGGTRAVLGEFPWMARLRFRDENGELNYGCSGFLISERFVLTAAHCFRFKRLGTLYQVQLGEHNTEEDPDCDNGQKGESLCADPPQLLRTEDPIIHSEFINNIEHHGDIAVIPLKQPATFTKYVYPICLSTKLSDESEMWLSGWGETERRSESPVKLKVAIKRADWDDCAYSYSIARVELLKSQLCAGNVPGSDSCTGDSGGPIMVQRGSEPWKAEGIVSFGMGCGLEEWPGVYTSIPYYLPWIGRVMNEFLTR